MISRSFKLVFQNYHHWHFVADSEASGQYRTVADIPRAYHGVAYVKGFIYVIGGFDGVNYFNTVRRMEVSSYDWIQVQIRLFDWYTAHPYSYTFEIFLWCLTEWLLGWCYAARAVRGIGARRNTTSETQQSNHTARSGTAVKNSKS